MSYTDQSRPLLPGNVQSEHLMPKDTDCADQLQQYGVRSRPCQLLIWQQRQQQPSDLHHIVDLHNELRHFFLSTIQNYDVLHRHH